VPTCTSLTAYHAITSPVEGVEPRVVDHVDSPGQDWRSYLAAAPSHVSFFLLAPTSNTELTPTPDPRALVAASGAPSPKTSSKTPPAIPPLLGCHKPMRLPCSCPCGTLARAPNRRHALPQRWRLSRRPWASCLVLITAAVSKFPPVGRLRCPYGILVVLRLPP
jgi:hypothetical protein